MEMTLKAGSLLKGGEYKIIRVLGQGGFGITYEAEQVALRRRVAVKEFFMSGLCNRDEDTAAVSVPSVGSQELVAKFRGKFIREARLIAAMHHPHIVQVHDVFEENGTAYYVMGFLPGGSLSAQVKAEGKLSEDKALVYIRQVANALKYVHKRNTLHLDIKPANILLDEDGNAVLVDFGVSKHYDEAGEQTSSTPVAISAGYAPLEQGRAGDVSQFSPATDIYALGATLYYLLSEQTPPEASIVNEDGLKRIPGISDGIWNAIVSAMQPRRKERPQSVEEFLSLLSKEKDDKTIILEPIPPVPPSPGPSRRFRYIALAFAACVAVVVFVLGITRCENDDAHLLGDEGEVIDSSITEVAPSDPTVSDDLDPQSGGLTGFENGHEWVDLGLPSGTKWATCNVGAPTPSDYGNYYAWGETSTKSTYTWMNYCFRTSGDRAASVRFSKYNTDSTYGPVDHNKQLDFDDDAARFIWGGKWRIPSREQWNELLLKSNCEWRRENDGYRVTSKKNGNSIYLPAAGWSYGRSSSNQSPEGRYWSSSLCENYPYRAWSLSFTDENSAGPYELGFERSFGISVRPVTEKVEELPELVQQQSEQPISQQPQLVRQSQSQFEQHHSTSNTGYDNGHEWVDLGLPSGTKWATCNVGASSPSRNGNYYAWGETTTKSDYSDSTLKYCTDATGDIFNKYVSSDYSKYWSGIGSPDNKIRLDLSDDAARANWGGKWRIPTKAQWEELNNKCTWSWTGSGCKVTGPNGQSITLPAAGCRLGSSSRNVGERGIYWSSSLYTDDPYSAWYTDFDRGGHYMEGGGRRCGFSVRPVTE